MKRRDKELKLILNDKVHGSTALLDLIYHHIYHNVEDKNYLSQIIQKINNNFYQFPVVLKFIKKIKSLLRSSGSGDINNILTILVRRKTTFFRKFIRDLKMN